MQWWPHRQFAFFVTISETNAANLRGCAKGISADPHLKFRKALAMCKVKSTINDEGKIVSIVSCCLGSRDAVVAEHELKTCPITLENGSEVGGQRRSKFTKRLGVTAAATPR